MLRIHLLLILAILVVPSAAALPTVSVKVAPEDQPGQAGDPYYLWTNVSEPDQPRAAKATDDCWRQGERPPPGPDGALMGILHPLAAWDPLAEPRLSGWFPKCVATEVGTEGTSGEDATRARASYDVTTGRYFLAADAPASAGLPVGSANPLGLRMGFTTATSVGVTGTTGVTMVTDCEECPPIV